MINTTIKKATLVILVFCLTGLTATSGCKKSSPQEPEVKETAKNTVSPDSLSAIIARRTSWNPILQSYYGKEMPDFQVSDINGKPVKLSDYRGKTVMVIMWATWCQPCMQEVPHINALREIISEDKLAILAISNEDASLVKKAAENKRMVYTVISYRDALPEPFSNTKSIPSAFYIKPDGTLKLATEGLSYLGEMKAIILAE